MGALTCCDNTEVDEQSHTQNDSKKTKVATVVAKKLKILCLHGKNTNKPMMTYQAR